MRPCCGAFGPEALDAAETAHREALADMQRRFPCHRIRFVRRVYAMS